MPVTTFFADHAWLGGDRADADVLIEVDGERIAALRAGSERPPGAVHLRGLTLPGLINGHSHAFHRALRGRTHRAGSTFWTWREDVYAVATALTPDSCHALARAAYAEMALAGITCVGEFHYLHHGPGGAPYADANADQAHTRFIVSDDPQDVVDRIAKVRTGRGDRPVEDVVLQSVEVQRS